MNTFTIKIKWMCSLEKSPEAKLCKKPQYHP